MDSYTFFEYHILMTDSLHELIVEESSEGIFVAQDGEILFTNDRLQELTGYTGPELEGVPKTRLVASEDKDLVETHHRARLDARPAPTRYEIALETSTGDRVPVELSISKITYEGDPAVVSFCREIEPSNEGESHQGLQELTREYKSVFENVQEALFLLDVDEDGTIRYQRFNEREEAVTGLSTVEVRGKTPVEVFGEELGREVKANYRECLEHQETISYEEELPLDGETTVWQTRLSPIVVDGRVERIVGASREITKLKQRKRDLERVQKRLRVLFEKAPSSIVVHDEAGNVLDVNEQTVENLGYTREALTSMHVSDYEVGIENREARARWSEMDVGETVKVEAEHERKDGSTFPVEVWVSKIEVHDEPQYLALSRDISARKRRKQELIRYESIVESMDDVVFVVGDDRQVKYVNPVTANYADVPADALEGAGVEQSARAMTASEADAQRFLDSFEQALQAEARDETGLPADDQFPIRVEVELDLPGGTVIADQWISPFYVEGDVTGAFVISRDITQRKEREHILERRQAFLENTSDVVVLLDEEGVIQYQNHCKAHLPEPDAIDMVGEEMAEVIHPDDHDQAAAVFETVLEEAGATASNELRVRAANGEWRWYENRVVNLLDDPAVEGVLVSSRDVTERKRQELYLDKAQEVGDIGWWRQDVAADQIYWSDRVYDMWGVDDGTGDCLGLEEVSEFVHPDDVAHVEEAWDGLLAGEPYDIEYRIETGDGETRWMRQTADFDRDADGNPTSAVGLIQDITERKNQTRQIRRISRAMEAAIDGMAILDEHGTYEFVNQCHADIYGYEDADALVGDSWKKLYETSEIERFETEIFPALDEDGQWRGEATGLRADGSTFSQELSLARLADGGLVYVVRDITERKEREQRIAEERERFQHLVTVAPDPIFVADVETKKIVEANEAAASIVGLEREEILGKPIRDLHPSADADRYVDLFSSLGRSPQTIEELPDGRQTFLVTNDGERVPIQISAAAVELGGRTVAFGIFRDISERREREQALRQFREAVESTAHAVYITDPEGNIEYVNRSFEEITGYASDEARGRTPRLLKSGEHETEYYAELWETIEAGERWENEVIDERADGDQVVLNQTVSPITDDDGTPRKFVAVAQDITQRKAYEEALEEQRDNLDVLNQVLRHDIRNDLQLVLAYAELVSEQIDGEVQEHVDTILESTEHAVDLTKTAGDMANVMIRSSTDQQEIGLRATVEREVEEVRSEYAGVALTVDGSIPAVDVCANEMLDSVFRNLLKNAIQHNDKSVPEVTVSAAKRGKYVRVRIADNGPGVPDAQKDDIFGKGEQGLESEGTGLGLYLVKTLVELYDGDVWVTDNDPEGAVFVVELPREG